MLGLLIDITGRTPGGGIALVFFLMMLVSLADAKTKDGRVIITAGEISRMKVLKIVDVLNRAPGLKASDTTEGIHGSYKVNVLVDGRPVNDPTSSVGRVPWDMIALENVEKIENLKGEVSLEYGDDASGDFFLNWKVHEKVSLTSVYVCLEAVDETTDLWLTAKARHRCNAQLTLSPFKNCTIVTGIDASSDVYTKIDNTESVPGYILYSLRGEYVF